MEEERENAFMNTRTGATRKNQKKHKQTNQSNETGNGNNIEKASLK